MPYIPQEQRDIVDASIDALVKDIRQCESMKSGSTDGVVNYCISRTLTEAFRPYDGWRYAVLNRAYGTFLSAAAEFLRRLVVPYEQDKAEQLDLPCYQQICVTKLDYKFPADYNCKELTYPVTGSWSPGTTQAFKEGYCAFGAGVTLNPYRGSINGEYTLEAKQWTLGYEAAEKRATQNEL